MIVLNFKVLTTKEDLKVIYKDNGQGIYIESEKTGLYYELLEGIVYKGTAHSDIVFIMICSKDKGQLGLLRYTYGASNIEDTIQNCIEDIIDFENHGKMPLDLMISGIDIAKKMDKEEY